MTGRSVLILLAVLAASAADAQDTATAPETKPPEHLQGFISHGDSGDMLEDFFGSRVERQPPDGTQPSTRKYDPALRWDERPIRR